MVNRLPDFKTDVRIASDFILSTNLCRKALEASLNGGSANIIRDLLLAVDMLAQSCHLSEFTDHGISHLVSIVDRASQWTLVDDTFLVYTLNPDEAFIFILSLLTHYAELIIMRSPLFANPATYSFRCIITPHKRAVFQRLDQFVGGLETSRT